MSDLKGYAGQLLDIDLTSKTSQVVPLDPELAREYIGGRALGIRMIMEEYGENYADIDPLGPEAILAIMTGPFHTYGAGKTTACFKSPQNNTMYASSVSGDAGGSIKFAGYDGIILRGQASAPVYIYIENDKVEIREAQHLWGMDVASTHRYLDKETPNRTEYLYISTGGENQVKFASIMANWYRAAGRGGSGAVMGSKNVKAIAIQGTRPAPDVADMETLVANINATADASANGYFTAYGTTGGIYSTGNRSSSEPVRNWQSEWHDEKQIQGQFFAADQWVRRRWADYGCTVSCSKLGRIQSGPYAGTPTELPDYEAGAYMGTNLGVFEINAISYLADIADKYGVDCIEHGCVLGFAAELYQRELLTLEDFDLGQDEEGNDIEPVWGNAHAFDLLTQKVVNREGIGDILAEGTYPAALALSEQLGEDVLPYAVHVKGIGVGAHGVRSGKDGLTRGRELAYGIQTQGGDHCNTVPGVEAYSEMSMINDTVGNCLFWGMSLPTEQTLSWLNAITGFGVTEEELMGEMQPRWINLQRASVLMAGWTAADDRNPDRYYEPLPDGPDAGKKLDPTEEKSVMQQAYAFRGWDENGIPTTETLEKYGLSFLDASLAPLRA